MRSSNCKKHLLAASLACSLSACSGGATSAPQVTQVSPGSPAYSSLQFAVGTANLYGASVGLNVVSTLRQPNGLSATGVNTPTLTGPFAFVNAAANAPESGTSGVVLSQVYTTASIADVYTTAPNLGPSLSETIAKGHIGGTSQTVVPGTPFCDYAATLPANANPAATFVACPKGFAANATTFGQSGGVFAMGLAPYNHVAATGQSYSYTPYAQPFYDAGHVPLIPWGGPPAFDQDGNGMGTRDGLVIVGTDTFNENYFLGVPEGVTAFAALKPTAGSYTLSVQIGTVGNGGSQNITNLGATAQLANVAPLPAVTAPVVTPDANGGATFSVALPPGATEGYLQIVDYGPGAGPSFAVGSNGAYVTAANCQGSRGTAFAPVYYTVHIGASQTVYALPPNDGPNTNTTGGQTGLKPSPSLCTAAQNISANLTDANGNPVTSGDNFTVQLIAFDYPAYAVAHSLITAPTQTPVLAGPHGQADLSLSAPVEEDWAASGYVLTPLDARHRTRRFTGAVRHVNPTLSGSRWGLGVPR